MRKVRTVIALVVALTLSGLAAYAMYEYLNRRQEPTPQPPVAVAEEEKVPPPPTEKRLSRRLESGMRAVTLAVDSVTGGSRELTAGDRVDVQAVVPIPDLPEGRVSHPLLSDVRVIAVGINNKAGGKQPNRWAVTVAVTPADAAALTSADPSARLQLIVRHPDDDAPTDQTATAFAPGRGVSDFSPQERNLSALIAPGMRAFTLEVNAMDGVGGIFRPSDRVDAVVISSYVTGSNLSENKPGEQMRITDTHRTALILLQDVEVVATEKSLAWGADLNHPTSRVTLAVTPSDAEKLTVLGDTQKDRGDYSSRIRLISRNPDDHEPVETPVIKLLDLFSYRRPYRRVDLYRGPSTDEYVFYLTTGSIGRAIYGEPSD